MKKQIKDLTNEEFEVYILNSEYGIKLIDKLKEFVNVDSPISLYNFAKLVVRLLENEINIDN